MAGLNLRFDERLLKRTVKEVTRKFDAVAVTLTNPGEGEVITSKRAKMPHERANRRAGIEGKKAVHGRLIAYVLGRRLGFDPTHPDMKTEREVTQFYQRNFARAIEKASRTNRNQKKGLQRVMLASAMMVAWAAIERIRKGQLGMNKQRYGKYKKRMQDEGIALQRWGGQWPPYGILTGRFIGDRPGSPGIRARLRNKAGRTPNTRRPTRPPRDVFNR
jgi:hypothetical protein